MGFNIFNIFSLFETQVSASEANFQKVLADAEGFVTSEVSAVDAAVVASLKTSLGEIFTPALWATMKTVAGQSAALLANEAFSVLSGQETLTVAVAAFIAGVEKIGVNANLIPSVISQQMITAGQAMVAAGVGAAVTAADISALKADIDSLIAQGTIPSAIANTVATAANAVATVATVAPVSTGVSNTK